MGSEDNRDRAYQQKIECSIMASNSISDHFYSSGWDQSDNIGNEFINPHYSSLIEHQKVAHIPSNSVLVDLLPSFGSGTLSEMVSSFVIPRDDSVNSHNSEDGALGVSLNGNRKRKLSGGVSSKNVEVEQLNQGNAEPTKAYVHVRAKKGQATNSHSLAERVRREKISERMKLLQEIVPGCDKITGKAVMLDEIINYVQSLQQQVEFLSMKLATVNPELDVDMDQILSKDIINSRVNNATALGLGPGLSSSHPTFHPLTQHSWNNELQSILQMGFDPNSSIRRFGAKWTVKDGAIEFCSEN